MCLKWQGHSLASTWVMRSSDFDTSVLNGVQVMHLILGHRAWLPPPGVLKLRCLMGCVRVWRCARVHPLTYVLIFSPLQDLRYFKSEKTSRGILQEGWRDTKDPIMCSYKLVTVKFEVWGLQTRVEQFVHKVRGHGKSWIPLYVPSMCYGDISQLL